MIRLAQRFGGHFLFERRVEVAKMPRFIGTKCGTKMNSILELLFPRGLRPVTHSW